MFNENFTNLTNYLIAVSLFSRSDTSSGKREAQTCELARVRLLSMYLYLYASKHAAITHEVEEGNITMICKILFLSLAQAK
jgi:hypothetical protein